MPPNALLFIYWLLAVNNTPYLIPLLTYLGGNGDLLSAGCVSKHLDGNASCKADVIGRWIEYTSRISFVFYINLRH